MIQIRLGRRLAMLLAALLLCLTAALTVHAADDALAPHAEPGDMDYIRDYIVTVDLREDGSADITYDIDWQVIAGDKTDYLTWVKIGLANAHVDSLTPLTDTIADLQYSDDGGSYAQVVFARRYYSPEVAAENGGESSVRFAFSVHQSHLFTLNDDGTANFTFTPGWFDDLSVGNMQIRWRNGEGFLADNTRVEGDYLVWDFGALAHGQAARAHVTVPVTYSAAFAPDAAMAPEDYGAESEPGDLPDALGPFFVFLVFAIAVFAIAASAPPAGAAGWAAASTPATGSGTPTACTPSAGPGACRPRWATAAPIRPATSSRAAGPAAAAAWDGGTAGTTIPAVPAPARPAAPVPVPARAAAGQAAPPRIFTPSN